MKVSGSFRQWPLTGSTNHQPTQATLNISFDGNTHGGKQSIWYAFQWISKRNGKYWTEMRTIHGRLRVHNSNESFHSISCIFHKLNRLFEQTDCLVVSFVFNSHCYLILCALQPNCLHLLPFSSLFSARLAVSPACTLLFQCLLDIFGINLHLLIATFIVFLCRWPPSQHPQGSLSSMFVKMNIL